MVVSWLAFLGCGRVAKAHGDEGRHARDARLRMEQTGAQAGEYTGSDAVLRQRIAGISYASAGPPLMGSRRVRADTAHMAIKDWLEQDRPREKLLTRGPAALSDSELLALFIGKGPKGSNAVESARLLLDVHGPLRRLMDLDANTLKKLPALGPASACRLIAALELASRHLLAQLERGDSLCDPASAGRYFQHRLRSRPHEVFAVLFLDTRNRTVAYEELFSGTIDAAAVYPREVVRRALLHNAAAVIVAHNHPSGHAEPSSADQLITAELQQALGVVGVRLLDHVVVGDGPPVSMAERGWITSGRRRGS